MKLDRKISLIGLGGLVTTFVVVAIVVVPFIRSPLSYRDAKRSLNRIWVVANTLRDTEGNFPSFGPITLNEQVVRCPECQSRFVWIPASNVGEVTAGRRPLVQCEKEHDDGTRWMLFSGGAIEREPSISQ